MCWLLEHFSLDELERPVKFLFKTVRRYSVDGRRPALGRCTEAKANRLPAIRKKGFVFHGRNLPARAEGGDLVRQCLRHGSTAGLLPEFAVEGRQCIEGALKVAYALVVRAHDSVVLRSFDCELSGDRKQGQ